mgnify:FL=1
MRKVTKDHVEKVHEKSDADLAKLKNRLTNSSDDLAKSDSRISEIKSEIENLNREESSLKILAVHRKNLNEKIAERKKIEQERRAVTDELTSFE